MNLSERFYLPDCMKPLSEELDGASERATVLIASAAIDDALASIIKLRLIDEQKIVREFFGGQGGLATFSARIAMGRLMNFYSNSTYSDLNIIRKIRNDAAHTTDPFSFETQSHRTRALSLKIPEHHFFEVGNPAPEGTAAFFNYGVGAVKMDPFLRYVGTCIFLVWNFSMWVEQRPEHLRPQAIKSCPI